MIGKGKGVHFKCSKEDHETILKFFRKRQALNMSGVLRELILDYIKQDTLKGGK
ncbi:hypothetical protein [Paenibacillus sp. Soil787]|uniref:hypothetical protein n=1 Tax=Paenibacillus sp. Soil787 TaxID=1736411 RepID=UPI000AA65492|nr:hypothetical protein [Paenibacillus sp. Soil787]